MNHAALLASIARQSARVSSMSPRSEAEIATVGFLTGALYSLGRATEFGYDDTRNKPKAEMLKSEFRGVSAALAESQPLDQQWLAGFYVTSALFRIGSLYSRIGKIQPRHSSPPLMTDEVKKAYNNLKHFADAHVAGGWSIGLHDLVIATQMLCDWIELQLHFIGSKRNGSDD